MCPTHQRASSLEEIAVTKHPTDGCVFIHAILQIMTSIRTIIALSARREYVLNANENDDNDGGGDDGNSSCKARDTVKT